MHLDVLTRFIDDVDDVFRVWDWKSLLSKMWAKGDTFLDRYPGLYALRNSHGPSWLEDFVMPTGREGNYGPCPGRDGMAGDRHVYRGRDLLCLFCQKQYHGKGEDE